MSSFDNSKRIIQAWIQKGDLEDDYFSEFICYWIAFNCWLYTKTGEVRDREALNKLYEKHRELFADFSKLIIQNKRISNKFLNIGTIFNNRSPNREVCIKDVTNFKEVIDMLYEIRCNLFHGSKSDTNDRDKEVVEASTPILELIVKNICLKSIH